MPRLISSADDAFARASKNKFRNYPSEHKQNERIIPFTTPTLAAEATFSGDAQFFVAGDCYARNIEKALMAAGKPVLSSPVGIGMPDNEFQQFQRYVIYNVDTIQNEFNWALSGDTDDMYDRVLIPAGEKLSDGHTNWSFSNPPEEAKKYRKLHNSTFSKVLDADVVIIVAGGLEQWYDSEKEVYINGIASPMWAKQFPGRFEHHHMSLEDVTASNARMCEWILKHSNRPDPQIFLTGTPGSDATTFTDYDIQIEYMHSRATQRVAIQAVVDAMPSVHHLPSLEYIFLSDRDIGFVPSKPNHINQDIVDRLVSDMLLSHQGETPGQSSLAARGLARTYMSLERHSDAIDVIYNHLEKDWPEGSINDDIYTNTLNMALSRTGRHSEVIKLHVENLEKTEVGKSRDFDPQKSFEIAGNYLRSNWDADMAKRLLEQCERHSLEGQQLDEVKSRLQGGQQEKTAVHASPEQQRVKHSEIKPSDALSDAIKTARGFQQDEDFEAVLISVSGFVAEDPQIAYKNSDLFKLLNLAYTKLGLKEEHIRLHLSNASDLANSGHFTKTDSLRIAVNTMRSHDDLELAKEIQAAIKNADLESDYGKAIETRIADLER